MRLVALVLNIMAPEFESVMYTTFFGKCLLAGTAVSMLFGAWVMAKLSKLKY